jgi:hypothetical protein
MASKFEIKGIRQVQDKLKNRPAEDRKLIEMEVSDTVAVINKEQVLEARKIVDTGRLWQEVTSTKLPGSNIRYGMISRMPYSPYVEFGTGTLVDVPVGLEAYALQFKGAGVKQVNLPARPYFFAPYLREKPLLLERLKKLANRPL